MVAVDHIETMRTSLVALLEGMRTSAGEAFAAVDPDTPAIAPMPGQVQAWVELRGTENGQHADVSIDAGVIKWWRWEVHMTIWYVSVPADMAATENRFVTAVDDVLWSHMAGGVDPNNNPTNTRIVLSDVPQMGTEGLQQWGDALYREFVWTYRLQQYQQYPTLP